MILQILIGTVISDLGQTISTVPLKSFLVTESRKRRYQVFPLQPFRPFSTLATTAQAPPKPYLGIATIIDSPVSFRWLFFSVLMPALGLNRNTKDVRIIKQYSLQKTERRSGLAIVCERHSVNCHQSFISCCLVGDSRGTIDLCRVLPRII
jgi:hypothetical protein